MSKANPIEAAEIPPHMADRLTSAAQRKVFGTSPARAAKKASAPRKPAAKKVPSKVAEAPASPAKE